ncbi:thiamine pyrophosphate-binding protein [Aestuariibius sp. 2305UL40-4]|uniref:thiamine pyrophosphate-binding protein n=1 Tax=Aestuariibius violaceus TaxID=3234132 RepID=UPI00345EE7B3
MPNAADILARRLYDAGCRHALGMPGGEVLTLVDALTRAGIRMILAKHENAAAFMAEGVYHRTGAPGILVATVGPGALNGVNAVANALQDRVPLIVLTGCVDPWEAESYTHQVLDQRAVFAPITKAGFTFEPKAAHIIADKAVAIATEGQPGPVHIDLPITAAATPVTDDEPPRRAPAASTIPAPEPLVEARKALANAKRPLIIAGVDAMNEALDLTAMAEALNAPVITTYKAKGLIPEDHPLALGGAGLSPKADKILLPLIARADTILCLGYDPIEMRVGWRDIFDPARQTVIDVTAAPNHHYMHQGSLNIIGSIKATATALLNGHNPGDTWPGGDIETARQTLADAFPTDEDWGPAAIIDTCRHMLPRDTLATADSGAHRILLSQMWACYEPRGLMQSSALCTMGCAVPLAIGAQIASPDRPVVSFSGDAGFLMVAGELATAAENKLKTIFVVFVDASLALIELKQRERQLPNAFVDFDAPDIAAIGRAFGGTGHTVRTRAELETAIQDALKSDTFTIIAAMIERGAYDGRI